MEVTELTEVFKLVVFYSLEIVVVAMVGVTLIAGLYQLIRDQVRAVRQKPRASHIPTRTAAQEPVKHF